MNRHPVDRLADLEAEIAERNAEASAIRRLLRSGTIESLGEEWRAEIVRSDKVRMEVQKALAFFGEAIRPFIRPYVEAKVVLKRRV